MCKESKGKLGEVKKVIPLKPLGILLIQPICDEIDWKFNKLIKS